MRLLIVAAIVGLAHASYALPPTEHGRGFRDGANHHLGDDGFVAKFGRPPGPRDDEHTRIAVHLGYVRDMLAQRPATRPELALRRTEILGYLDEYIASGIEPKNTYVPWRSPVFIDRDGKVCAVAYLIERTSGHELAESIARTHRLDYLEDIAGAMPEVRDWIATSGLTVTELASIQPGYNGPEVQFLDGFDETKLVDGDFAADGMAGKISHQNMVGHWTVTKEGVVLGKGDFARGAGTWTSFYPDGKAKLAAGKFAHNRAEGTWEMFHPSGHLAARGAFHKGKRDGAWQFFYDTSDATPISAGKFANGSVAGTWRHFDRQGKLLAKASHAPKRSGGEWVNDGLFLSITAGNDGVIHEMHGGIPATTDRLDGFYSGSERLYVDQNNDIWDADGNQLTQTDGSWYAAACSWTAKRKRAAHAGDIVTVHVMMLEDASSLDAAHDEDTCGNPKPVGAVRDRRINRTLAARTAVRAPAPKFVSESAESNVAYQYAMNKDDLASVIAGNMAWYMEWPFIDGKFREVFATLPGY